jgi:hypothetical protein
MVAYSIWTHPNQNIENISTFIYPTNDFLTKTLDVYPNPTNGSDYIQFYWNTGNTENEDIQVTILDVSGKVLETVSLEVDLGVNHVALSVTGLSKGIYLLRMKEKNKYFLQNLL